MLNLENCIAEISKWMHWNFLKLTESNIEYLVVGSQWNLVKLRDVSNIKVGDMSVETSVSMRNMGAIFGL